MTSPAGPDSQEFGPRLAGLAEASQRQARAEAEVVDQEQARPHRKKAGNDFSSNQQRFSMYPASPAVAAAAAAAGMHHHHHHHQQQQNQQMSQQLHAHHLHQQYLQLQAQMLIMQHQLQQEQVRLAQQKQSSSSSREFDETNVYVAHLPTTMTHEEFFELMSKFGTVVSSRILVGDHWRKKGVKGVGFARMSSEDEALAAVKGVNNTRLADSGVLLRARLAFKTVRRDGHPDGDDGGFPEPDSNDDAEFRTASASVPRTQPASGWPFPGPGPATMSPVPGMDYMFPSSSPYSMPCPGAGGCVAPSPFSMPPATAAAAWAMDHHGPCAAAAAVAAAAAAAMANPSQYPPPPPPPPPPILGGAGDDSTGNPADNWFAQQDYWHDAYGLAYDGSLITAPYLPGAVGQYKPCAGVAAAAAMALSKPGGAWSSGENAYPKPQPKKLITITAPDDQPDVKLPFSAHEGQQPKKSEQKLPTPSDTCVPSRSDSSDAVTAEA